MNIKRPVLRYHGGKYKLAKWIISYFPEHKTYVEPFGGAASVLMQKPRSYAEVYNDKWQIVVNVFRVLRDPQMAKMLEKSIALTPYSRSEFEECGDFFINQIDDPIEKARRTIFRSFSGFGSASTNALHSTGFRANSTRLGTTPAHDWANYPIQIKEFTERLRGVTIENKDYKSIIKQQDSRNTLFFLDPPYVHSTRNMKRGNAAYAYEMSDQEHTEMASIVNAIEGKVIICGYESPLYKDLFAHWRMEQRETFADGAKARTEILWMNY